MITQLRYEDWKRTYLYPSNRFAYLKNELSVRKGLGRNVTWYFDNIDEGYEGFLY